MFFFLQKYAIFLGEISWDETEDLKTDNAPDLVLIFRDETRLTQRFASALLMTAL